jgi:hypothetical protein
METKFNEFLDLKQGEEESVMEYFEWFTCLSQYVLDFVNTNEKKKFYFLCGLNEKLQCLMATSLAERYNEVVSQAVLGDNKIWLHQESKRKKFGEESSSKVKRYQRVVYQPICILFLLHSSCLAHRSHAKVRLLSLSFHLSRMT